MKRLTNFILSVSFGIDLDIVESILFKFQQSGKSLNFEYPSPKAIRKENENVVLLKWTIEDTLYFETGKKIEMDTFIKLNGTDENPETEIVSMVMNRTLFEPEEV